MSGSKKYDPQLDNINLNEDHYYFKLVKVHVY